jgi:hypothetical protein
MASPRSVGRRACDLIVLLGAKLHARYVAQRTTCVDGRPFDHFSGRLDDDVAELLHLFSRPSVVSVY